jgi:hypothetical protein
MTTRSIELGVRPPNWRLVPVDESESWTRALVACRSARGCGHHGLTQANSGREFDPEIQPRPPMNTASRAASDRLQRIAMAAMQRSAVWSR